jgi:hypothetical protein
MAHFPSQRLPGGLICLNLGPSLKPAGQPMPQRDCDFGPRRPAPRARAGGDARAPRPSPSPAASTDNDDLRTQPVFAPQERGSGGEA